MSLDTLALDDGLELVLDEAADGVLRVEVLADGGRPATAGDGAYAALLAMIVRGEVRGGFAARRVDAIPVTGGTERAIDVDQSNVSIVVGDRAVVKRFPRVAPGPQPGLDVPTHLAAVGFREMPAPYGALTWSRELGPPALLASATAYLPGATDGWSWFVREIETGVYDDATASAGAIGGLVARLHRGLATPSATFPEPLGEGDATAWRAPAIAVLEEAVALTTGEPGERLRSHETALRAAFGGFTGPTRVMRIHGDLHVGQILRWDGGLAVSDFDGNPLAPPEVRVAAAPPARDVASMARAIDHAGRVVQRRRPEGGADVEAWLAEAREAFLDAYRADAGDLLDERLLYPFEVAQTCHEYVYAARYLPHWVDTPDRALPHLARR